MQRVSTNLTLFYKFFIPVFWTGFAGAGTATMLFLNDDSMTRLTTLAFFALSLVVMYFTLFQLKRVEMGDEAIYVTNYFKHFRYPYHNIEKITHRNFVLLQIATIHFRVPGSFGKTVRFVPSKSLYADFWTSHPELKVELGAK